MTEIRAWIDIDGQRWAICIGVGWDSMRYDQWPWARLAREVESMVRNLEKVAPSFQRRGLNWEIVPRSQAVW